MIENYFKKTKALLLPFILTVLFTFKANAQCPTGTVTFTTQAQVDQFAIDYPNCTSISGALQIGPHISLEPSNITDLSPLAGITNVSGNLYIQNNGTLQNVDGLNITTVGGWLYVGGDNSTNTNLQLTNLNGLSSLTSVAEDIYISYNPVLTDISALQNTTFTPLDGYGLTIINNPALAVCNLPNFCTYLANPAGAYPREISGNSAECANVVAVAAACGITLCSPGNVTLTTQAEVDQFAIDYPFCTQINGVLTIDGDDIINLDGLNNIASVTAYMAIQNNALLENVNGLENITTLGTSLSIINNPVLLHINGLTGLSSIGTEIQLDNNALLQNISGLSNVSGIGGGIWITSNPQLQTLNGLQNIQQVGGDIEIAGNAILNDISFLQNVDPLSIVSSGTYGLTIVNNPNVSVCNLPNFCSYLANPVGTHPRNISGNLAACVNEQAVIEACSPTPAGGCLTVTSTVPQFPTSTFSPQCTGSLESITPSNNAETGEYSKVSLMAGVAYTFSSSVNTDYVTISNEDGTVIYTYGTASATWTATANEVVRFYIHLDDECNSSTAFRTRRVQCSNLSIPESTVSTLSFYPNPVKNVLNFSEEVTDVKITDVSGRAVKQFSTPGKSADLSNLSNGVYIVSATTENGETIIKKIIKE